MPEAGDTVDPDDGLVTVQVWGEWHARQAPKAPCTVVRVKVERLPRRAKPPAPMWLVWIGKELPEDLLLLWH